MQDARYTKRNKIVGILVGLFLVVSSLGVIATLPRAAQAAANIAAVGGGGATLPYVEMEAHDATTNGTILGPDYTLGDLASDAVDRQAVELQGQGKYVQFTLPQQANSINLRYSIPDSSSGGGINASLSVYINGVKQANDLQLTSKYSWVYGQPGFSDCNSSDWSNTPGGTAHHQFDEVHMLLPQMAQGTTVKLQVDSEDTAPWYALDVADFQQVPTALTEPSGYISVTSSPYNADPTGVTDSTTAIQNAVNAGESQGKGVWIPRGTYLVTSHILVNNVTLTGAGPWYSILTGAPTGGGNGNNVNGGTGVGIYGNDAYDGSTSSNVTLSNLAVEGQITNRVDCLQDNGIGGSLNNSTISNVWVEHTKVGMWFDGPFSGLTISNSRIDSTLADGINFHRNITNSTVTQTAIRGTGDDGLAMWSSSDNVPATGDASDSFTYDTIQSPYLANGIAIYGGNGNSATNDLVSDSQYRGGGIMLDYEDFGNNTVPFAGTTNVSNDTIQYTGGYGDQGIQQFGALMFWADTGSLSAPFTVSSDEIDHSQYAAISFDGGNSVSTVSMNGINISGAAFAFSNKVNTITGSASNVTASGLVYGGMESCEGSQSWQVTMGSGNSGWSPTPQTCGFPTGTPTPGPSPTQPLPTPTPTIPATPTPTPSPTPAPTGTLVTAIDAGGSASGNFVADTDFNQGNEFSDTSTAINTARVGELIPQAVWQTCRWNSAFTYTIPGLTPGTTYTVALDWAELSFTSAGQRLFNVAINGTTVLSAFDVYANAGYKTALQKQFAVAANSSGQIVIAFTQGGADNPFISGIEIWNPAGGTPTPTPTPTNTPTPVPTNTPTPTPTGTPNPATLITAIDAGGGAVGNFVADTDYNQGNTYSDASSSINPGSVSNPAPQQVYQTCRWNSAFTYTIPGLTPGTTYTVDLDWAELTWTAVGQRKFNVAINGNQVLTAFDVYANAGYKTALQKQFSIAANSSGQIVIAFTQGGADNPFISGIEIWNPAGTPTPPPTQTLVTAINAGGASVGNFVADTGYDQGNEYSDTSTSIITSTVSNPAPQAVWQSCRWNSAFTYTLTGLTPGATYTLDLDWAELTWTASGEREFNVAINGNQVLTNFDVYAIAGYKTALQKQFTVTADSNGHVTIAFTRGSEDNPFISGIELYTA